MGHNLASCPHGCQDGWLDFGDSARACECRRGRSEFKSGYRPGGNTKSARRRELGRQGGLKSGRRRRQLAKGRPTPRERTQKEALALAYKHRQVARKDFLKLYTDHFPPPEDGRGAHKWEEGRETAYKEHVLLCRWYRSRRGGQHYRTTNGQLAAGLSHSGRPRCSRTVRRVHRRLERMGLVLVAHEKRGQAQAGRKDCLRVEMRSARISYVRPPLKAGAGTPSSRMVPAPPVPRTYSEKESDGGRASPSQSPPAPPAENEGAASPPGIQSEERELEQAIGFWEQKLAAGYKLPRSSMFRLHEARAQLRRLRDRQATAGSGSSPPEQSGSDG